jgi:hypothetical protein
MTARKYITDQWQPLSPHTDDFGEDDQIHHASPAVGGEGGKEFQLRHILFFASVVLLIISPLVGWLLGSWGAALLCMSLAGILFGISALLVPSKVYQLND